MWRERRGIDLLPALATRRGHEMAGIDQELQSRFESERQKAMLNVMFTANWFKSRQMEIFRPHGLSLQQYNILRILRGAKDRMRAQDVKGRMIDRAPNATRLTDKLIAKGLVLRERCDDDRRVIHLRISPRGLELLAELDIRVRSAMKDMLKEITEEEARALNRILDMVRNGT